MSERNARKAAAWLISRSKLPASVADEHELRVMAAIHEVSTGGDGAWVARHQPRGYLPGSGVKTNFSPEMSAANIRPPLATVNTAMPLW